MVVNSGSMIAFMCFMSHPHTQCYKGLFGYGGGQSGNYLDWRPNLEIPIPAGSLHSTSFSDGKNSFAGIVDYSKAFSELANQASLILHTRPVIPGGQ